MFLRRIVRRSRGKTLSYWALAESYRTARGPRQRILSYLGELTATERRDWAELTEHFQQPVRWQQQQRRLFEPATEAVPERITVDVRRVRVERTREFGEVWLALVLWQKLGLERLLAELLPVGQEEIDWATVIGLLVVAPSATFQQLHVPALLSRHGVGDLLGVPIE
jgi:hypothetical protein